MIQCVQRVGDPAVLGFSWLSPTSAKGVLVQIASNVEFAATSESEKVRTFLLPNVAGCTLDAGHGQWYVRVGALIGDIVEGSVEWSGIYGPWPILSSKPCVVAPPPKFKILHTKPTPKGLILYTDPSERTLAFWEVSEHPTFPAALTTWSYGVVSGEVYVKHANNDNRRVYVRPHLLFVPVQMFEKPLNLVETPLLGAEYTIHPLCSGRIASGVPIKPRPMVESSNVTQNRGDAAILHQQTITPNMKFSSHGDYLRYIGALARR
jgi:hypothetical protein